MIRPAHQIVNTASGTVEGLIAGPAWKPTRSTWPGCRRSPAGRGRGPRTAPPPRLPRSPPARPWHSSGRLRVEYTGWTSGTVRRVGRHGGGGGHDTLGGAQDPGRDVIRG